MFMLYAIMLLTLGLRQCLPDPWLCALRQSILASHKNPEIQVRNKLLINYVWMSAQ